MRDGGEDGVANVVLLLNLVIADSSNHGHLGDMSFCLTMLNSVARLGAGPVLRLQPAANTRYVMDGRR